MKPPSLTLPILAALEFTLTNASASPSFYPATGSWYDVVVVDGTWGAARAAAESASYLGMSGRLATITSQSENDFVGNLLPQYPNVGYVIGASQPSGAANAEGWAWITGEDWSFTNWAVGEPNNYGGNEDFLVIYSHYGTTLLGTWNDVSDSDSFNHGYVIEYAPIPEPSTIAPAGLGIAALMIACRRK